MTTESVREAIADLVTATSTAQFTLHVDGSRVLGLSPSPDPVDVYAVQKGIVAVLVGMAEHRGLLSITDPVSDHLGAGWTAMEGTDEARVTIETVLTMTTGMDDRLGPLGRTNESWRYDNTSYNHLKRVLQRRSGLDLQQLSDEWLLGPLGMTDTRWVDRGRDLPDGTPITGLLSTAEDLAAFGAMVLDGGRGLVPEAHLATLARPGSAENPAWGRCWWNNSSPHHLLPRREEIQRRGPILPHGPDDLIAARGAAENFLHIVPSLDLVLARTSDRSPRAAPTNVESKLWELLGQYGW